MSQPVGSHWIRAGNYIKAVGRRPGQKMNQELMGQTAAVRQHIDPAAMRQGSVVQTNGPAVGDRTQKTLLDLAWGVRLLPGNFTGQDAPGPLGQLLGQRVGEQNGPLVLHDLRRSAQTPVGPLVAALVALHACHDLMLQRPQGLRVIAVPHVDVSLHRSGIFGLHHVGRCFIRTLLGDKLFDNKA